MVDAKTNAELSRLISMEELQGVMKALTHETILGCDGWPVKLSYTSKTEWDWIYWTWLKNHGF